MILKWITLLFGLLFWLSFSKVNGTTRPQELAELRNEVKEMFFHVWRNYLEKAYPKDELMPLSCKGRTRQESRRGHLDDILGK